MYQAIVFLPLLGAIIAGAISIVGAARRYPGGEADDHGHGGRRRAPMRATITMATGTVTSRRRKARGRRRSSPPAS